MKLILAFKAFLKAWNYPSDAQKFIDQKLSLPAPEGISSDNSHLRLLSLLQHSGRLIDFLKEDIAGFSDAQVGAAVRTIHDECAKSLEDLVTIRPIMQENEGAIIHVAPGYDPSSIKVVGNIKGDPPFSGILIHKGWKAHKRSLPKKVSIDSSDILCPAEIEVK